MIATTPSMVTATPSMVTATSSMAVTGRMMRYQVMTNHEISVTCQ
jgi:hypothetical protein